MNGSDPPPADAKIVAYLDPETPYISWISHSRNGWWTPVSGPRMRITEEWSDIVAAAGRFKWVLRIEDR